MSKNSFRKALRHIKSKKIDERLELLSEIPTNSTSGAYVDTPGQFVQDPDVDNPQFSDHPLDLTQDDSATDTTGLFLSDGTILSAIPPGDNSYVLGPMMSMNYSWGNFTQIGYVRQSDRKMVNLARITGTIGDWDGESGFTSYGQLTLEQAKWFRDQSRSTYFAFYPGPPSDGSDDQGRYEGEMVNRRRTYGNRTPDRRYVDSGSNRSGDPSDNYSAQNDKDNKDDKAALEAYKNALIMSYNSRWEAANNQALAISGGILIGLSVQQLAVALTAIIVGGYGTVQQMKQSMDREYSAALDSLTMSSTPAPAGESDQQRAEREAADQEVDDAEAQYGADSEEAARARQERNDTLTRHKRERRRETGSTTGDARRQREAEQEAAKKKRAERERRNREATKAQEAEKIRRQKEQQRKGKQRTPEDEFRDLVKNEERKLLSEDRKRILREIKKPYKMPETPTKFKVSPKVIKGKNKVVGADMMKQQEIQKSFKPKPDNIWGKGEYAANVRASQEKKNTVLELVGAAEHHWTTLTEKSQREKQEKINEMMAAEHDREMKIMYEKYQKNQNKVDKIRSHYQGKPSPEGYPENPPPKTVNGYHPKYGKNYKHDKLDPHSAESMPKTGDQEIDANIDKATDHEKKDRKLKILNGKNTIKEETTWDKVSKWKRKITEGMTTAGLGVINLEPSPNVLSNEISAFDSESAAVANVVSGESVKLGVDEGQPFTDVLSGSNHTQLRRASFNFDSTRYDTFVVNITNPGGGQGSWCDPSCIYDNIVRYTVYDSDNLSNSTSGTLNNGDNTIQVPSNLRVKNVEVYIRQYASDGVYADGYNPPFTINSISTKRLTPINLFVPLDDPEALSFIRGGLGGSEERRQRLKEQLEAGNKWLRYLGLEPSKTSPGDIELAGNVPSPTGSGRVPYGTPGADKPYTRKGYIDSKGKFVDFDNPATWPSIPKV